MPKKAVMWNEVLPLSHITKNEYCVSDAQLKRANKMVTRWVEENPSACIEEQINFARILMLTMQIDAITNNKMLMDGRRPDKGQVEDDDFPDLKMKERALLPKLQMELDKALTKSGKTGQQKKISEDLERLDVANYIYNRHKDAI